MRSFKLSVLLEVSKLPRSTFFYTKSKDGLDKKNENLIKLIKDIFYENKKRYGYRRITLILQNEYS
ncbi:MAG: transposase, partial [Kiritimatiellae bacterium]|nr:transposase [Kiritimatiellia bacterium]